MKRKSIRKITAEEFTPDNITEDILNKLFEIDPSQFQEDVTFLDPACGDGNLLVNVLKFKLRCGGDPIKSLKSLYGVDIIEDNVIRCRERLLTMVEGSCENMIINNIIHVSIEDYPKGSLDFLMG